ncbi:hypothetical protein [Yoonia sp. SS1-5]|uniref:Uncharacterized protein n=1 Tax=Yoonia rhodophyticola TaxID=3137370 RepID=A0AAN0MAR0_9RHOB
MAQMTFELTDLVGVIVTVTELEDGSLQFALKVDESLGTIGDLNALYFDLADETLIDGLTVTGVDVTGEKFAEDKVTKIDSFTNINGEVVNEYGKFDAGIQLGTSGMAKDDIQETTFILSHNTEALTLDDIMSQDFAVRLTSVGEIDGARDGSLKIGGTASDAPDAPEDPEQPEDPEGPTSANTANNDAMTVFEFEGFSTDGSTDLLESGLLSILENDTTTDGTDTFIYNGDVTGVNGDTNAVAQIVEGSNGGQLIVYADGTVDFSANGEFNALAEFESAQTSFDYEIEGGSTATIDVTVLGISLGGIGDDILI